MNPLIIAGIFTAGILGVAMQAEGSSSSEIEDPFNKYDNLFKTYGNAYGIPWKWLKAICLIESNLGRAPSVARGLSDPSNVSGSTSSDGKSWGLMQLTLPTARQFESATTEVGLNNPETSIRLAAKYLQWVVRNYYPLSNQEGVIRSYNGGPGWKKGSAKSLSMTSDYYAKFIKYLNEVDAKNP